MVFVGAANKTIDAITRVKKGTDISIALTRHPQLLEGCCRLHGVEHGIKRLVFHSLAKTEHVLFVRLGFSMCMSIVQL